MDIRDADKKFNFEDIKLSDPVGSSGQSYFTAIKLKNDKPLLVQLPQIATKQGFVKQTKKITCDLMFGEDAAECVQWFESLETHCHKMVFEKSNLWFENSLDLEDIEAAFASSLKTYKSGKFHLCRCNVGMDHKNNAPVTKVYDENENRVAYTEVTENVEVIPLMEVKGIKFTSRSFQLEFDLVQLLIVDSLSGFDKCLIKKTGGTTGEKVTKIDIQVPKVQKEESVVDIDDGDRIEVSEEKGDTDDTVEVVTELAVVPVSDVKDLEKEEVKEVAIPAVTVELDASSDAEDVVMTEDIKSTEPPVLESVEEGGGEDELELIEPVITVSDSEEAISIHNPHHLYQQIYKQAKLKARNAKRDAIKAILEAQSIKNTYMLDDVDLSDVSDFEDEEVESAI